MLSHLLLGELDSVEHKVDQAMKNWTEAAAIAKALNDVAAVFRQHVGDELLDPGRERAQLRRAR